MSKKHKQQPPTRRQRQLIRARAKGKSLADAAIEAGYRCRSRASAEATARTTLRRLTGRPEMRECLVNRGLDLDWAAGALLEMLDAATITEIRDGDGKLIRQIMRWDGRYRWQAIRIVLQAFEAFAPGDEPSPLDDVSDDELAAIVEGLRPSDAAPGRAAGSHGTVSVFEGVAGRLPARSPGRA